MRATLRDVAKLADVHPGTVSRALNPDTLHLVNEETARRVHKAADELGYVANSIARGLKTNRSHTVGVLVPDLMNPLFASIVRGIQDTLEQAGYTPLIANTDNDPLRERKDLEAMRARQVDGVITATARDEHAVLDEMAAGGMPIVLVLRRLDAPMSSATADDHSGARMAVEYLVMLGHSRIAYLGGPPDVYTAAARWDGFQLGMKKSRLEIDESLVRFGAAFTVPEGRSLCEALLEGAAAPPTAIVAGNDLMALGCYDVFKKRGLRCPEDISIIGFNDMPFSDRFDPPLTTIRVPQYEMGTTAGNLLLEQLLRPGVEPRHNVLGVKLVTRDSTARRKRSAT